MKSQKHTLGDRYINSLSRNNLIPPIPIAESVPDEKFFAKVRP